MDQLAKEVDTLLSDDITTNPVSETQQKKGANTLDLQNETDRSNVFRNFRNLWETNEAVRATGVPPPEDVGLEWLGDRLVPTAPSGCEDKPPSYSSTKVKRIISTLKDRATEQSEQDSTFTTVTGSDQEGNPVTIWDSIRRLGQEEFMLIDDQPESIESEQLIEIGNILGEYAPKNSTPKISGENAPKSSTPIMYSSEEVAKQAVQKCETLAKALEKLKEKLDDSEQGKSGIKCFKGEEGDDPHMFLRKFENYLSMRNINPDIDWNKTRALFYQHLQGPAEAWFAGIPKMGEKTIGQRIVLSPLGSWGSLKEAFIARFASQTGILMKKLAFEERILQKGERVSSYLDDLLVKGRQLNKSDEEISSTMLRGVPKAWRNFVWGFGVTGLLEVMEKLKIAEATIPLPKEGGLALAAAQQPTWDEVNSRATRDYGREFDRLVSKIEGRIDNFEARGQPFKNPDEEITCFGCGGKGHIRRDCSSFRRPFGRFGQNRGPGYGRNFGQGRGQDQGQDWRSRSSGHPSQQVKTDNGPMPEGNGMNPPI